MVQSYLEIYETAILNNPKLKSHEAVIDKENITSPEIPEEKRPAQSISSRMSNISTVMR